MTTFVIVGGGLAGAKAAETLRAEGFDGEVVLFGSEPDRPYERPPLSKGYLLGKDERESAFVHPASWYGEHNVDLRTGVTVAMIDPAARLVTFDGGTIGYDVLADWRDPDGDDIYLDSATPTGADQVRFTPDGFITFRSLGGQTGAKQVRFVVSDGRLNTTGTLEVDVQPAGKLGPVGTPDFARAFRGKEIDIAPLGNDVSPDGGALDLLGVSEVPSGAQVVADVHVGTP